MTVKNRSLHSVNEAQQELIKNLKSVGMSIRIPRIDEDDELANRMSPNKNTGRPDIGAIRNGNEVYFAIIRDFRECYKKPTRRARWYEIAKIMAKPEQILLNLTKSYKREGFSVRTMFVMLNCLPSDINSPPLNGIERKILSPKEDALPKHEQKIFTERQIPEMDYEIKKNRVKVVKEFLRELFDIGIRPNQITEEDFYEGGLRDFLYAHYNGSARKAMIDAGFRLSQREGRGLPPGEVERIERAYYKYEGYANQAARALRHSTCTILRCWRKKHFKIRPNFQMKYLEGKRRG